MNDRGDFLMNFPMDDKGVDYDDLVNMKKKEIIDKINCKFKEEKQSFSIKVIAEKDEEMCVLLGISIPPRSDITINLTLEQFRSLKDFLNNFEIY